MSFTSANEESVPDNWSENYKLISLQSPQKQLERPRTLLLDKDPDIDRLVITAFESTVLRPTAAVAVYTLKFIVRFVMVTLYKIVGEIALKMFILFTMNAVEQLLRLKLYVDRESKLLFAESKDKLAKPQYWTCAHVQIVMFKRILVKIILLKSQFKIKTINIRFSGIGFVTLKVTSKEQLMILILFSAVGRVKIDAQVVLFVDVQSLQSPFTIILLQVYQAQNIETFEQSLLLNCNQSKLTQAFSIQLLHQHYTDVLIPSN
ncbi:Hypothetical_protein [Hexamita inflata]|uniref:Hypothetical_protein n=1 Tax=Hexamita inflata TaxID=28002 RepID=A0AA86PU36_9EUKA|nr:Hypothetical protein HINF_LOCUS33516 [Hexamita inflata]